MTILLSLARGALPPPQHLFEWLCQRKLMYVIGPSCRKDSFRVTLLRTNTLQICLALENSKFAELQRGLQRPLVAVAVNAVCIPKRGANKYINLLSISYQGLPNFYIAALPPSSAATLFSCLSVALLSALNIFPSLPLTCQQHTISTDRYPQYHPQLALSPGRRRSFYFEYIFHPCFMMSSGLTTTTRSGEREGERGGMSDKIDLFTFGQQPMTTLRCCWCPLTIEKGSRRRRKRILCPLSIDSLNCSASRGTGLVFVFVVARRQEEEDEQ